MQASALCASVLPRPVEQWHAQSLLVSPHKQLEDGVNLFDVVFPHAFPCFLLYQCILQFREQYLVPNAMCHSLKGKGIVLLCTAFVPTLDLATRVHLDILGFSWLLFPPNRLRSTPCPYPNNKLPRGGLDIYIVAHTCSNSSAHSAGSRRRTGHQWPRHRCHVPPCWHALRQHAAALHRTPVRRPRRHGHHSVIRRRSHQLYQPLQVPPVPCRRTALGHVGSV
jgi:hypothetical protein